MLSLVILFAAVALVHSHTIPENQKTLADIDPCNQNIKDEILAVHNKLRRDVQPASGNMLKMEWNEDAAKNAAEWAKGCQFLHSEGKKRTIPAWLCGENLFQSGYVAEWPECIQEWYDEEKNYTYGIGPAHEHATIGHFTQVVWAQSYQVGCAVEDCGSFLFYVCHYCPAGNEDDEIHNPYTSAEPCEYCRDHCDDGLCTNPCPWIDDVSNCEEIQTKKMCNFRSVKGRCDKTCNCVHGLNPKKKTDD